MSARGCSRWWSLLAEAPAASTQFSTETARGVPTSTVGPRVRAVVAGRLLASWHAIPGAATDARHRAGEGRPPEDRRAHPGGAGRDPAARLGARGAAGDPVRGRRIGPAPRSP